MVDTRVIVARVRNDNQGIRLCNGLSAAAIKACEHEADVIKLPNGGGYTVRILVVDRVQEHHFDDYEAAVMCARHMVAV